MTLKKKFLSIIAPAALATAGAMYWLAVVSPHILGVLLIGGTAAQLVYGYYYIRTLDDLQLDMD